MERKEDEMERRKNEGGEMIQKEEEESGVERGVKFNRKQVVNEINNDDRVDDVEVNNEGVVVEVFVGVG